MVLQNLFTFSCAKIVSILTGVLIYFILLISYQKGKR